MKDDMILSKALSDVSQIDKKQYLRLLILGAALSALTFIVVLSHRALIWHSQRDLELRETYQAFLETGTLLIKAIGTGSYNVQAPALGPWVSAAWDDDPGAYIIASLMGVITKAESPYLGLGIVVALLSALPLFWLPTTVARLFKDARAGYSVALLPIVMWLTNQGSIIAGSQYGLSDNVAVTPVYAIYGLAASLVFLSLSLVLLFATFRMKIQYLIAASLLIVLLSVAANITRSLSGYGIALSIGAVWWLHSSGNWKRFLTAALSVLAALALTMGIQSFVMNAINIARSDATNQNMQDLPNSHGTWHPLYLGLSWPEPVTGQPSDFNVKWDDLFGWAQAQAVNPNVVIGSAEYDQILKDYYLDAVSKEPLGALTLYGQKFLYVLQHFSGMIMVILLGGLITLVRRDKLRSGVKIAFAISLPTLALGLIPPVLVMPMLYYYSELTAALSLLVSVSLGGITWSLTKYREMQIVADKDQQQTSHAQIGISKND